MSTDVASLNWLVESFATSVPGLRQAVVVSADGLLLAYSGGMDRDQADQLAAIASGLASMTVAAATHLQGGDVHHLLVETEGGLLLVMQISDGSSLAVLADRGADVGLLGYEMALLVTRMGDALTPALRSEMRAALA
ncbi:MAG TPA: roadblock/LC7 domain-containing protein [Mycobacteriales bacterium]